MTIERLVRFLEVHGVAARVKDGRLFADAVYTRQCGAEVWTIEEEIRPTLADVRAWLGY